MSALSKYLSALRAGVSAPVPAEIYPKSVNSASDGFIMLRRLPEKDEIIALGIEGFSGELMCEGELEYTVAQTTHENACVLRRLLPFTAPVRVLGQKRSFGVGDRLGIAGPGHIRVFRDYDAYPVLAQQSMRELALTERSYEDVLDCASFAVFREGFCRGFGADGDHLKKAEDIEYALGLGYTMITLDCSEHIRGEAESYRDGEAVEKAALGEEIKERYLSKPIKVGEYELRFTLPELARCALVYGEAIEFASRIYKKYFSGESRADFEISIDETATPTSPLSHYFVAAELLLRGVTPETVAPRFCGEFQKGIDYIGNLAQFESELKLHAAIARHFNYKLSIHSGSDKFSVFALIGKYTEGNFHVKTAGTNWLEAVRAVSAAEPGLYRELHRYALEMFDEATKYYHVTTDLTRIPALETLSDAALPSLFENNDARQLIHITYGFILTAKNPDGSYRFRDRLYKFWRENERVYDDMLYLHIGKHLQMLYSN